MTAENGRIWIVDQNHPQASDAAEGTEARPFITINRAAELAQPGDTVLVKPGVYRERVNPRRGGEEGRPIVYQAAEPQKVFIRGSDAFQPQWQKLPGQDGVYSGSLLGVKLGADAYAGQVGLELYGKFNPYVLNVNKHKTARPHSAVVENIRKSLAEASAQVQQEIDAGADIAFSKGMKRKADLERELALRTQENARYMTTLGQMFVNGAPMTEVETLQDLNDLPATWMVSPEGDAILLHFPVGLKPQECLVELSVRHTVFAPLQRGLGYITVRGFVIEHGANHFPTWGRGGWPQVGLLSCRTGHHWVIEDNIIRHAKSLGIDCGSEGPTINLENGGSDTDAEKFHSRQGNQEDKSAGYHLIRNNWICDNGHCGIAGIRHYGTKIVGNIIERNNRIGYTSPNWEFAGIKFHYFFDGLIEGNLIRDNEAHGIWIDNQWRNSRITRNVIVNNLWSGINVELGRGPVLIDNNVIAYTRQGDGVYGHDVADVTIAHNLIYANANFGVWFAYCTPRVKPQDGCWDIKTFNNMILGNRAGAVAYPIPWDCAGNNLSDGNLLMGGGEYLDEGSRPMAPLFQFTNKTHVGQMAQFLPKEIKGQTPEVVRQEFIEALEKANVPKDKWPNLDWWGEHYYVSLEIWRAVLGNDLNSKVIRTIRDGLASRMVSWDFALDETILQVSCQPVEGVDKDFLGRPMPEKPLPGPFQQVDMGINHIVVWPVRGVPTTWSAM